MKIYRIRNKITGEYLSGGHSAQQGMYISKQGAVSSFRRTRYWWIECKPEEYELVEFDLLESGTYPIPEKK